MPKNVTIRVHYMRPGFNGKVDDFISFRCMSDDIPDDLQQKTIASATKAHDIDSTDIELKEIEYREA